MKYSDRIKFRVALIKLIDNHQEEFEKLCDNEVFQVNQTDSDKVQVLFSKEDGMELTLRPITEKETVVR